MAKNEGRKEKVNLNTFNSKYLTLKKKVSALQLEVGAKGSHPLKKNLFCEKISQTGGGSSGFHTSIFFLGYIVNAPKYSPKKK